MVLSRAGTAIADDQLAVNSFASVIQTTHVSMKIGCYCVFCYCIRMER